MDGLIGNLRRLLIRLNFLRCEMRDMILDSNLLSSLNEEKIPKFFENLQIMAMAMILAKVVKIASNRYFACYNLEHKN